MQRWLRLSSLLLVLVTSFSLASAQNYVEVRGSLSPGQVRVFVKDTIYRISGTFTIGGTLVIEPGTRVEFMPNGRLIDSTGGRIIADGRASATYNAGIVNALFPPYNGYDDPNYYGAPGVVTSVIATEPTIHPSKHGLIFNVDLGSNPNLQGLTPAKAIIYKAARLELGGSQPAIRLNPWFRPVAGSEIHVKPARITFVAGDVNNFSREWGHIVVLPGAKAAFFRDVDFLNFRKDTTVDNEPYFLTNAAGAPLTRQQQETMNDVLLRHTNGSGGAITTFSSRTWIVGCVFRNNMARYRGGALQVLQAPPEPFPNSALQLYPSLPGSQGNPFSFGTYAPQTNPYLTYRENAQIVSQSIPAIDMVFTNASEPSLSDGQRMSVDDARIAMYLGRIRQVRFINNKTLLSDVDVVRVGPINVVTDVDRAATVNGIVTRSAKNHSYGGAVYIEGRTKILVGMGVNDFQGKDTLEVQGNLAENRQATNVVNNQRTYGAKGGGIHVGGDSTHLILAGRFTANKTSVPYVTERGSANSLTSQATYSQGGAVYTGTSAGQLQIRGGLDNNPPTHFIGNQSARGGAVYVARSTSDLSPSPMVGGSDGIIVARNYGFNIKFRDNIAHNDGGAIFTERNMQVYGSGGVSGPLWIYGSNYGVEFNNNTAGFSGGAIAVHTPPQLPISERVMRLVRANFVGNRVGEVADDLKAEVRGGGGVYTVNADLNVVKGVEFRANKVWNGNGGAIASITPDTIARKRLFITDVDQPMYDYNGVASSYSGNDDIFTWGTTAPRPDERMLTRFYDNEAYENPNRQGNGTTQSNNPGNLTHPGVAIRENGTGLGGAIYVLDSIRVRVDTVWFDRVRFQGNLAHSGAAIYSDNYDLKIALQRCLVTNNTATSPVGRQDDTISGPMRGGDNHASSDLAGAILYGEITGPLPWTKYSFAANSIYDNDARFVIRLPDAQDTKGVLAGTTGLGFGGVDTLRGNYWGQTEANVNTILPPSAHQTFQRIQSTFFIAGDGRTHMRFNRTSTQNTTDQGPFESTWRYIYKEVPIYTIPDTLLMAGRVYDIFDKGTDIKTADYSNRRMSPIEDFAVGIPPTLKLYADAMMPSNQKYVKRMTRDPYHAEEFDYIGRVQTEFVGDHPIGYPLFIETRVDYSQVAEVSNNDARAYNETVFFVVNERTGDYIRVNARQKTLTDTIFRARVELVPDSSSGGDPNVRRSYEGLSSYGTGASLLAALYRNAYREDSSALAGRRWEASAAAGELGNVGGSRTFRLGNRPGLPLSNNGLETYYGGERFRALPVREGDEVTVFSRTVLWKAGPVNALAGALQFRIGNTTNPPIWTGAADTLSNAPSLIPEMRNRVFVTENRLYTPVTAARSRRAGRPDSWFNEPASYPADPITLAPNVAQDMFERDSIFALTAWDVNKFYDPVVIMQNNQSEGSQLSYFWKVIDSLDGAPHHSALKYWLRDTLVTTIQRDSLRWNALGYRILRGRPINPYIVPGGEEVEVVAKNFPPSLEIVDSLRKAGYDEDIIANWLYLYPKYFHAESYDNHELPLGQRNQANTNARYLQQDTVNFGWLDTNAYRFRIHVTDSMPRFLWAANNTAAAPNLHMMRGNTMIVLDPTTTDTNVFRNNTYLDTLFFPNTASRVGRFMVAANAIMDEQYNAPAADQPDDVNVHFVANLTDSLRFKVDFNTDDEWEDFAAEDMNRYIVNKYGKWDFRFGRTAYGFMSTAIRNNPGDTTLDEVLESRPRWLSNTYFRKFNSAGTTDAFLEDFTTRGQINIRIHADEARTLLRPNPQTSQDLNTDTLVTIVANDGHGGISYVTRRLFVNVAPTIVTDFLPDAIEDVDYNPALLDSNRRIKIYDPNWGQKHTFTLIYGDEARDSIPVDPYFEEAGFIDLNGRKTTPQWLRINPVSGILYGTPRVTDVPNADTTIQVTVLVEDRGGLNDIRTLNMRIQFQNHDPHLFATPIIRCIDAGKPYTDTIRVTDIDLARKQAGNEELTFEVIEPAGVSFTFTPSKISSPVADTQQVVISTPAFNAPVDDKGQVTIRIVVRDRTGASDTLVYKISVSAEARFTANVRVSNNIGAYQDLTFGVGGTTVATFGNEQNAYGTLDYLYCEYEIPPVPPVDVFDARWTIPTRNGVLRNIYPFSAEAGLAHYNATFQPGGEQSSTSAYYPMRIVWCRDELPDKSAAFPGQFFIKEGPQGSWFAVNMKTGQGRVAADIRLTTDGTCDTITIYETRIGGFVIQYDYTSDVMVENGVTGSDLAIVGAAPSPFTSLTTITFDVVRNGNVEVAVYDVIGNKVASLVNEVLAPSRYSTTWDGTTFNNGSVAGGVYTVRISDGVNTSSYPIVLTR